MNIVASKPIDKYDILNFINLMKYLREDYAQRYLVILNPEYLSSGLLLRTVKVKTERI
jgi:hypothetical protein